MARSHDVSSQLGNYQLMHVLKQGRHTTTYLGRHIHTEDYVVVKTIRLKTDDQADQFRCEAETIAELTHPNIARAFEFGVQEDIAFLVTDFAPFGSLWHQYARCLVIVPLPAVVSYMRQIAEALYYAHQRSIIHRDVKPENMLIARDARILLSDFSIALSFESLQSQHTPDMEDAIAAAAYLAPEQIHGEPGPASDQYALAITVYEWLCSTKPFKGRTLAELTTKHLSIPPPPMSFFVPAINPDVEQIVLRGLAKDPEHRFPSVQHFAEALEKAAGVEPRSPSEERFTTASRAWRTTFPQIVALEDENSENTTNSRGSKVLAHDDSVTEHVGDDGSGQKRSSLFARRTILLVAAGIVGAGVAGELARAVFRASSSSAAGQRYASAIQTPTMVPELTPTKAAMSSPVSASNPRTGALISVFYGHTDTVFSVVWSPDGKRLASGGVDQTAQVWRAVDGVSLVSDTSHTGSVNYVAWSPDGTRFASASDDQTVRVCSATTGKLLFACIGHSSMVHSAVWSPNGKYIASGSYDTTVRIWNGTNGAHLMTYTGHAASVWTVAWSPDGTKVASASGFAGVTPPDNTVKVWDVRTGATLVTYTGHRDSVIYVTWSPDGKHLASGSADTTVQVWDATTGETQQAFRGHSGTVYGVVWSPDGKRLASGSVDTTVQLWDVAKNTSYYTYRGHTYPVYGVAWSPDGTKIASGGDDTTVRVWRA